jgi:hypothetical protein
MKNDEDLIYYTYEFIHDKDESLNENCKTCGTQVPKKFDEQGRVRPFGYYKMHILFDLFGVYYYQRYFCCLNCLNLYTKTPLNFEKPSYSWYVKSWNSKVYHNYLEYNITSKKYNYKSVIINRDCYPKDITQKRQLDYQIVNNFNHISDFTTCCSICKITIEAGFPCYINYIHEKNELPVTTCCKECLKMYLINNVAVFIKQSV